jgi:hypothetical protein
LCPNRNRSKPKSEQLTQLQRLQAELHDVNGELQRAAQPLRRLDELSLEERRELGEQIRAWLARWEFVTQQISLALRGQSSNNA